MIKFKRWVSLSFACLTIIGCSTIEVEHIDAGKTTPAIGMLYALPATVVRSQFKIDRVEKGGAPYARFAAIFSPDGKPVCPDKECPADEKVAFSLEQGATLSTYGEPDVNQIFLVKFTGGGAIDQSLSMTWNEAGLLSTVSATVTNRTIDVVSSGIKMVAGIGSKFAGGAARTDLDNQLCPDRSPTDTWVLPILKKESDINLARTLIDNYCRIKLEDRAKWSDDQTNHKLLVAALSAYDRFVAPLANTRTAILNGTSNALDQVNLMAKLDTEIDSAMTRYFIGKSATKSWSGVVDSRSVTSAGMPLTIPLFKLDEKKGICLVDNAAIPPDGAAIPNDFQLSPSDCAAASHAINLTVSYYPARDKQLFTKITDVTDGTRSFRYRIPAQVEATLGDGKGGTAGAAILSVAQLGTVISLPANRHSKTLTYELAYVEATGALKSFKLGTTGGLDSSTVDTLSGAAGTAIDAHMSSEKNRKDLAVLTQQDQLLKLRDDICTIQKKYGITCTVAP